MRKERLELKQEWSDHLPPTPTVQTPLMQKKKKALTMAEKGHGDKSKGQRERVAIAPWLTPPLLRSWGICFFNGTSRRTWLKEYDTKPMTEILNFLCHISKLWRGRALPLAHQITHGFSFHNKLCLSPTCTSDNPHEGQPIKPSMINLRRISLLVDNWPLHRTIEKAELADWWPTSQPTGPWAQLN